MTNLVLPPLPRTPMFINEVMTREWQDYFLNLENILSGVNLTSLEDILLSVATGLYTTPQDYNSRIDDLERRLYQLEAKKSYDNDIDGLNKIVASGIFTPSMEQEMQTVYTSLGLNKTQKDLTFSSDTGTVNVFTVTGDVFVSIIPVITTDVTSAAGANIRLGAVTETDAFIVDSLSTDLDARGIWVDQTPDHEIEPLDRVRSYIITDGNDIVLTLDAQVDTGAITFYCFWTALSSDGLVEAA